MNADKFDYKGYTVKIEYEDDPMSPRDWDNLGTMVCDHNRYNLGDIQVATRKFVQGQEYFPDVDSVIEFVNRKDVIALPLYLYDHAGITMKTSPFHDSWDSGQVGYIYVTYEKIRKEYSWTNITSARRAKIEGYLRSEVATYDQFLTGDVYGYIVENENGEHVDSCWGFYGLNDCKEEARSIVDWYVKQAAELVNFEI